MSQPTAPKGNPDTWYHNLRIRRRTSAEWCLWLLWLITLIVLAEFAITSFAEHERQAGILASVLAVGWLCGGIIVEVMKGIDLRDRADPVSLDGETDTTEE